MKAFLDVNVVLDVLLERPPFFEDSRAVLLACESGKVEGLVSSLSFSILHYLLAKRLGSRKAGNQLRNLRKIVRVAEVGERTVDESLQDGSFRDFEDALQYYAAIQAGVDYFVTGNVRDFKSSRLPTVSPSEMVALLANP